MAKRAPVAVVPTHRHGNEGGKPKDHGDELNSTNSELVSRAREAGRCKSEVGHCEQSPEGCEEHEIDAVRRPVPAVWAMVPVDDCKGISVNSTPGDKQELLTKRCQTQHDDREQDLHATKAEDKSWGDHGVMQLLDAGGSRCRWRRLGRMRRCFATEICKIE
jgi:hypothetical protein